LVQLPIPPPGPEAVRGNVPLAAAYLKLFARRQGLLTAFRIELLPAAVANTRGDRGLVEEILRRGPWMVGFTCCLWNIERTLWITRRLKEAATDLRVVLGGPEITLDNRWLLEERAVDYAVIGEGEQTFSELLAALRSGAGPTAPVPGLWTRQAKRPPRRKELPDLDAIGSPYVEGILDAGAQGTDVLRSRRRISTVSKAFVPPDLREVRSGAAAGESVMLLETARGCRYRCKYCYYPHGSGSIRRLSAEKLEENLRYADRQNVSEVFLLDPTLNQRADFADLLRLLARGNPRRQFTYSAELRAEGIDAATAHLLAAARFEEVEIGLQSLDPEAQRLMGRAVDLPALERGAKAMLDEGIRVRLDLILGLPGDTADSIRRGFDYLDRARPFSELQIFNLSILPGTAFRAQAAKLGLEFQPRPPYYVLKTPTLDTESLYRLMEEALDRFGIELDALPPVRLRAPRAQSEGTQGVPGPIFAQQKSGQSPPRQESGQSPGAGEEIVDQAAVDLDGPSPAASLPPAARRAQAFTLWLRAADFHARRDAAAQCVAAVLADNPHTTLQVVVEPADPRRLTSAALEAILAACHESLSYLDWYYSLHPRGRLGAKRLVVVAPWAKRRTLEPAWMRAVQDCATLVWCKDAAEGKIFEEAE
jgi:radical SAM superfamily enzyme YgiQ (UPF0313 family)